MEGAAAFLASELRARRECFVGAEQDVQTAIATLENGEDLDLVKRSLLPLLRTRRGLLGQAVGQIEDALGDRLSRCRDCGCELAPHDENNFPLSASHERGCPNG